MRTTIAIPEDLYRELQPFAGGRSFSQFVREAIQSHVAGLEAQALVLQNDLANRSSPTVTVLPISSRADRVYPFQVRIPVGEGGLGRESKVLSEQIRTVPRQRLGERIGELSAQRLQEVREALDRHL